MLDQEVLGTGLAYQVLLGFGTAAVLIWAAWDTPRTRRAKVAFVLVMVEVCGFYALAGTRTRVFLTLLMIAVVIALPGAPVAAARAGGRRGARGRVRERAARRSPGHRGQADRRGAQLGAQVPPRPARRPQRPDRVRRRLHRHHRHRLPPQVPLARAVPVRQGHPGRVPLVCPGTDRRRTSPRAATWSSGSSSGATSWQAGRPYTVIGDFWNDFGFPGVVAGLAPVRPARPRARGAGLAAARRVPGREYRVVLYAIALVVLYTEVVNTYSVAIGFVLTIGVPFLVAMHLHPPARDRIAVGSPAAPRVTARPRRRLPETSERRTATAPWPSPSTSRWSAARRSPCSGCCPTWRSAGGASCSGLRGPARSRTSSARRGYDVAGEPRLLRYSREALSVPPGPRRPAGERARLPPALPPLARGAQARRCPCQHAHHDPRGDRRRAPRGSGAACTSTRSFPAARAAPWRRG